MTHTHSRNAAGWQQPPPEDTPRLRLKPKASPTGLVDGAWWPHSTDLVGEIPDLLAVLSVRLGSISHVIYRLGQWAEAPAKVPLGDRYVRLSGYTRQPANTVEVIGLGGKKVILLVVPPDTDPGRAHAAMMAAAAPDDASTIDELLDTGA